LREDFLFFCILGATQTLIKQGVLTCRSKCSIESNIKSTLSQPKHRQVTVECPVRLDLSGGWTDTPPICYEHGGSVLNVAITINDQRPIGARAKLVESTSTSFVTFILKGEQEKDDKIYELHTLAQFADYNQPQRPCALLKTCCIFTGIVDINTTQEITLSEQLKKNLFGYNLILEAWSNVPVGSGLGTSSILAGAILLALWNLIGNESITDSMIIRKFIEIFTFEFK
jgi:fucokinase